MLLQDGANAPYESRSARAVPEKLPILVQEQLVFAALQRQARETLEVKFYAARVLPIGDEGGDVAGVTGIKNNIEGLYSAALERDALRVDERKGCGCGDESQGGSQVGKFNERHVRGVEICWMFGSRAIILEEAMVEQVLF